MENLVTDYFDRIMIQAILGQTLSSGTASTGLGSGLANLHSDMLDEIVKYVDAIRSRAVTVEAVPIAEAK